MIGSLFTVGLLLAAANVVLAVADTINHEVSVGVGVGWGLGWLVVVIWNATALTFWGRG